MLEAINRAFVENGANDREAILAYINRRDSGCLKRRGKKVHIRSLWSDLSGKTSVSTAQIETESDGSLYIVQKTEGSYLDQKNLKRHMTGWQRDMRREMGDQGKSVAYQTESSNAVHKGPPPLEPVEVKFAIRAPASQLETRAYIEIVQISRVSRCRHYTADTETIAHAHTA